MQPALKTGYTTSDLTRAEVDAMRGAVVLDFGTSWCGYCRLAEPLVAKALASCGPVSYIKVEDGRGRLLGRSFQVKLWPTLIFMRDGVELVRLIRPSTARAISSALSQIKAC
jgi:thioredoxin 1